MARARCGFEGVSGDTSPRDILIVYGPTLVVSIGFDPNFQPKSQKPPAPGISNVGALVDTGATESCIDALLASQLNLPIVDRRTLGGVHGSQLTNMHLAQIYIPGLKFTIYGAFAAVALTAARVPHKALIGRTFLQHFTMVYEGLRGNVTLSSE